MEKPSRQKVVFLNFKQSKSGMSPQKVILIAMTFTMSILCVTLEPTNFLHVIPGSDNDCQCFFITKTIHFDKIVKK